MDSLPPFSQIQPDQVQPAVTQAIADCKQKIEDVLAQKEPHTWDSLIAPLEEVNDRLSRIWSPISHLNAVQNSEALRVAHDACLPLLSEFQTYVGQHEGLYQAYLALSESDDFPRLGGAQRKEIQNTFPKLATTCRWLLVSCTNSTRKHSDASSILWRGAYRA